MKTVIAIAFAAGSLLGAADQTFTGVITDSMCGKDHSAMKISPDSKCAQECAKTGSKYSIYDGRNTWTLSDQASPAQFAGKRVTVTGKLFEKTGIIQVGRIEPAR